MWFSSYFSSLENLWFKGGNLQICLCYLAPHVYIFKEIHMKSRTYKTDHCSSDFSCAKEFLEAITLPEQIAVGKTEN